MRIRNILNQNNEGEDRLKIDDDNNNINNDNPNSFDQVDREKLLFQLINNQLDRVDANELFMRLKDIS